MKPPSSQGFLARINRLLRALIARPAEQSSLDIAEIAATRECVDAARACSLPMNAWKSIGGLRFHWPSASR